VEILEVSQDGRTAEVRMLGKVGTISLSDAEFIRDVFKTAAATMRDRQERGVYRNW
jgi:hypothetical protein